MTVSAIAGVAVAALTGPAFAHVEVSADKTQAGAADVTLTFNGEAENPKAGIQSERVVLPTGIAPADVTLVRAPAGWKFTSAADGFTVGGKALKIGTNAVWKVKIAKLPDGETRLSFKTLETYGNGDISRWIEIQQPGQDEPDNPAPLLTLKPGAVTSTSAPSETASSAPVAEPSPTTAPLTAQAQPPVRKAGSSSSTWWIWVVVVALVVVAGGLFVLRRRRGSDTN
jgi:LPXTG-motif cell wall-anchored protein